MKYLFSLLMMMASVFMLHAQPPGGVGIGTSSPMGNAILELSSTTKGFLLPRMTAAQRGVIGATAGLIVYDTDFKEYYHGDGTFWRKVLNSTFWNSSSTRQWMYNTSDSIGIGTSSPDARLDVVGNVKTSARIDAGGVVQAAGLSSTGVLYVSGTSLMEGNLTGNSNAGFNGNINSNTGMSITDAAGILQFKNGATEKSYVQLSGDDLRMGTNSGNTTGNLVMRLNGNDLITVKNYLNSGSAQLILNYNNTPTGLLHATSNGDISLTNLTANKQVRLGAEIYIDGTGSKTGIGTSTPSERLHVNGNVKVGGQLFGLATGTFNMMPLCYARINSSGTVYSGTPNLSASKDASNYYFINCPGITASSVFQVTPHDAGGLVLGRARYFSAGVAEVTFADLSAIINDPSGFHSAKATAFFIVIYSE